MPGNTVHAGRIICPYYLWLARNNKSIICEGLIPGSVVSNDFQNQELLTQWVEDVCETHGYCDRCLLAQAIGGKYMD